MLSHLHTKDADARTLAQMIEATLAEDGWVRTEPSASLAKGEQTRRISLYERDGWVGVCDDALLSDLAGPLSAALGIRVLSLAGECDHAFFSEATLWEKGAAAHKSMVPDDATLEADGRHRIRPTFLAGLVPAAKKKLAAGVVVNPLGGEENVVALGAILGLPRPGFSTHDEDAVVLTFRRAAADRMRDAAKLLAGLEGQFAAIAKELGAPLAEPIDFEKALAEIAAGATGFGREGAEPSLYVGASSPEDTGWLGEPHRVMLTFALDSGTATGFELAIGGDGLSLLAPPDIAFVVNGETRRVSGKKRVRVPKARLEPPPDLYPNSLTVELLSPKALRAGKGSYTVTLTTLEPRLEATFEASLEVKVPPPLPVLPKGRRAPFLETLGARIAYAGRDVIVFWAGFDAPWKTLAPFARELADRFAPLLGARAGAEVLRKGGERLTFRSIDWTKLAKELARGADVRLGVDDDGAGLEILHQPDGSNHFPDRASIAKEGRRYPQVVIAASVPDAKKTRDRVTALAEWALAACAAKEGSLGAFVTAQGSPLPRPFYETPYETLAGVDRAVSEIAWLSRHARTPGWRVLLPKKAAKLVSTKKLPKGVVVEKHAHGVLVRAAAKHPAELAASEARALERWLVTAIGTAEEANEAFLRR